MTATVIPLRPAAAAGETLDALQRRYLMAEAADNPPRQSTLIAMLASADPAVREQAIRELEQRRKP